MANFYGPELMHYGVKGMKWGVRRYQPYPKGYRGSGNYNMKEVNKGVALITGLGIADTVLGLKGRSNRKKALEAKRNQS